MSCRRSASALAMLLVSVSLPAVSQEATSEPLPIEDITTSSIEYDGPRVYFRQASNVVSVRAGDDLRRLGQFSPGNNALMLPPFTEDGMIYTASLFYSRGHWGDRTDFLEIWDPDTLTLEGEVEIPPRHTLATTLRTLIQPSHDGRYIFIQNSTPATSVTVVDLESQSVTGEIATPGCWGIYPSQTEYKFATLCGDGTIPNYVLSEDGSDAERFGSEQIFDVDADALFTHGEVVGDHVIFVSFTGNVYRMDLEAETPTLVEKFNFVEGVEGAWRPGGHQISTYMPDTNQFFVLMHSGGREGSHKEPAEEIWILDLDAQEVTGRTPSRALIAITASPENGALYGVDELESDIVMYELDESNRGLPVEQRSAAAGAAPRQIEVRPPYPASE